MYNHRFLIIPKFDYKQIIVHYTQHNAGFSVCLASAHYWRFLAHTSRSKMHSSLLLITSLNKVNWYFRLQCVYLQSYALNEQRYLAQTHTQVEVRCIHPFCLLLHQTKQTDISDSNVSIFRVMHWMIKIQKS